MRRTFALAVAFMAIIQVQAQRTLSLQECRNMALDNNKQIQISKLQTAVAHNIHQAAKTKYLPHVDGVGGYQHFTKEISLLNNSQKSTLSSLGTAAKGSLTGQMTDRRPLKASSSSSS